MPTGVDWNGCWRCGTPLLPGTACTCWLNAQPNQPWPYTYTTNTLAPLPHRISDEDVERIAKRVAELVKPNRKRKA